MKSDELLRERVQSLTGTLVTSKAIIELLETTPLADHAGIKVLVERADAEDGIQLTVTLIKQEPPRGSQPRWIRRSRIGKAYDDSSETTLSSTKPIARPFEDLLESIDETLALAPKVPLTISVRFFREN